jgi:hypothetical protein
MTRRPRENGWRDPLGITHHINTRHVHPYAKWTRQATCGADLCEAARVKFDTVDCMTCIVQVAKTPRLPPRPTLSHEVASWWTTDGNRHVLSQNHPWRAVCGSSLRGAHGSGNPPNCPGCRAAITEAQRAQEGRGRGRLPQRR